MQDLVVDMGHNLAHLTQLIAGRGRGDTEGAIDGLVRGQMVHPWTDAADPVDDTRDLLSRTALDELLKPAQGLNVQKCIFNIAGIIKMNGNFCVSFYAGNWCNIQYSSHINSPPLLPVF